MRASTTNTPNNTNPPAVAHSDAPKGRVLDAMGHVSTGMSLADNIYYAR